MFTVSAAVRFLAVWCFFMMCVAAQTSAPSSQPAEVVKGSISSDKKATDEVSIKSECRVLEDVWRRRTALHYLRLEKDARDATLKAIAPESAGNVRRLVDDNESFTTLDYHFVEKTKNCEQRLLNRLRADKFQGVADLLEIVKGKNYPVSEAYADLLNTVELNLRHAVRKKTVEIDDVMKDLARKLTSEAARVQGTAGHTIEELARAVWKDGKPEDFPAQWFDRNSEVVSFEFGNVPAADGFPRVDLATAGREQLTAVPEVEPEIADAILSYRAKRGIQGVEELRFIDAIPAHHLTPLQSLFTVSRGVAKAPKKSWTVMVYLNAANNLEPFGIKDMNEMEKIGSDSNVNIVVECARFRGKQKVQPNSSYLSNPYMDGSPVYYLGLDNEPGTRRYYILKDDDMMRVRSVMMRNVGETDAGRPEPLADFGKWTVENFPADHYALVIWNHGAGWSGVSSDDNTHHAMDMGDVRTALEGICAKLKESGKDKIDVLDFDACLMATVEVAYELKDTVEFLAASQETEPGDGMLYSDYLKWLATYPEAAPASLAKSMAESYVRSYAPSGEQAGGPNAAWWGGSETKSVIRCDQASRLRDAIEDVAKLLHKKPELLGDVAEQLMRETRAFGRLVDVHDFFQKIADHLKSDAELKAAVAKVHDVIGYPNDGKDTLVNEVVISRRSPGRVIWGWNGWVSPPQSLAPFVADARWAKTPLVGPDEKGNYTANIAFPPMLLNPKTGKPEFVKEINYRFDDDGEKRTVKDFQNTIFTADFPRDGVVVAEGHNIGNSRSHGISLYFPAYLGYDKEYDRLKFAENSHWAALVKKFPIKKIEKPAPVALLGINHVTKADREELGKIVVREELDKKAAARDWAAPLASGLKTLGRTFDSVRDPRPYGQDWAEMLTSYENGVVILDNTQGGETFGGMGGRGAPRIVGPDGRDLMRHLRAGGDVLLGSSDIARAIWDTPLYRDTLGLEYVSTWNRSYKFGIVAKESAGKTFEIETSRPGQNLTIIAPREGAAGVESFAVLPDGRLIGAKVARTDPTTKKSYRAVVLGFYLADVRDDGDRTAILKAALEFLEAGDSAEPTPSVEAATSRPIDAAPIPVGTGGSR